MTSVAWPELRAELRRFVASRVAPADAEDVVQEALVRIHRGIGAVRDRDRIGAWIHRVMRNAIADHHRRGRSTAVLDPDEVEAPPLADDDTSFTLLAACVTPFVAMLPPVYRQAISMVELEGLSQVDAAHRLGIPVSTMKSRVQRGRAQLRAEIDRCCQVELDARGHVTDLEPRARPCPSCGPSR